MDDLVKWLRVQLDEDEAWARAASRAYPYADEGSAPPPDGVHWRWAVGENWEPVTIDPAVSEFVAEPGYSCSLVTVEEWPTTMRLDDGTPVRTQMMPLSYAENIVEMDAAAGGHIVRHDPASVLREVEAKRLIIDTAVWFRDRAAQVEGERVYDMDDMRENLRLEVTARVLANTLSVLAAALSDRPGYREEWRP